MGCIVITCPVLEELDIGRCLNESTVLVWAPDDGAQASVLSCAEHVPLARRFVRDRMHRVGSITESPWPDWTRVTPSKPAVTL